jgi:hypothetical protein
MRGSCFARRSISRARASISRSKSAIKRSSVSSRARVGAQPEVVQEAATAGPEQVGLLALDSCRRSGVDAVLECGAHVGQHDPLPEQIAQVAPLPWAPHTARSSYTSVRASTRRSSPAPRRSPWS